MIERRKSPNGISTALLQAEVIAAYQNVRNCSEADVKAVGPIRELGGERIAKMKKTIFEFGSEMLRRKVRMAS